LDAARALDERSSSPPVADVFATRPALGSGADIFAPGRNGTTAPRRGPERASSVFDRGLDLLRQKQLRAALAEWRRALELDPDNRTYRTNLRRLERMVEEVEAK